MDSWFFVFHFPAELFLGNCGSGRDEETQRWKVLRLIRIRKRILPKAKPLGQLNFARKRLSFSSKQRKGPGSLGNMSFRAAAIGKDQSELIGPASMWRGTVAPEDLARPGGLVQQSSFCS